MLQEKLALPKFEAKFIEEINTCRDFFNRIDDMDLLPNDKIQSKKKIISDTIFDMFIGTFDLQYDTKLKFTKEMDSIDSIYVDITKDFDDVFYEIYTQCFCKYISKMHLLKDNRIDSQTFKLARMIVLNKDNELIKKIANNIYITMINKTEIETNIEESTISEEEILRLTKKEKERLITLIEEVERLNTKQRLSLQEIKKVFSCFSSNVFYKLNHKQKAHIANLIYNYFKNNDCYDNYKRYLRLFNKNISNKRCLEMIIEDLFEKGNSMLVKKKNMDIIDNVASGLPYIYKNETDKSRLNLFDDLVELKEKIKTKI